MTDNKLNPKTVTKIQRRLGISQIAFAQKIGLSYSYIQKLSYGNRPMTDAADKKIRERCGLSEEEIAELDKEVSK